LKKNGFLNPAFTSCFAVRLRIRPLPARLC